MSITIAHFYYDLLNLYGESGNVKALKMYLEKQGIDVKVKFISLTDTPQFDKYDMIYIGTGTEDNQKLALKHLIKYKDDIKTAIKNKKFFLITGNSIELFGKYIIDKNKKKYKALSIFNYKAYGVDFRIADEGLFTSDFLLKPILGFQNQNSIIKDNKTPAFKVIKGVGSYPNSHFEGIIKNNFYGTYLIGPVLIRNPHLLKFLGHSIINEKFSDFKFKEVDLSLETKAYDKYCERYYLEYTKSE